MGQGIKRRNRATSGPTSMIVPFPSLLMEELSRCPGHEDTAQGPSDG